MRTIIIIVLCIIITVLSAKVDELSQVEVLSVVDNNNGTYTLEIQQGQEVYDYHFENQ